MGFMGCTAACHQEATGGMASLSGQQCYILDSQTKNRNSLKPSVNEL